MSIMLDIQSGTTSYLIEDCQTLTEREDMLVLSRKKPTNVALALLVPYIYSLSAKHEAMIG